MTRTAGSTLDWDSIREAEGFKVGDSVRYRGKDIGTIRNLIHVQGRHRALVYWPTIRHADEDSSSSNHRGSEQFVDLNKLSKVNERLDNQPALL